MLLLLGTRTIQYLEEEGRRERIEREGGERREEGGEENKMEGRKEDHFCSKMILVEEGGT